MKWLGRTLFTFFLTASCLSACGRGGAAHRQKIVDREVARLRRPPPSLSAYGKVELSELELADEVADDERKIKVARDLEARLRERLKPLFTEWQSTSETQKSLLIRPRISRLRIVSGGARLWAGAFAGDSHIDLELGFVDERSQSEFFQTTIALQSGGMAGTYSVGSSDRNLIEYVADVAYEFLKRNHTPASSPP